MDSILGKFDRNFIVAAFIPSLTFTVIAFFVFGPIIPPAVHDRLERTLEPLDQPGLIILLLAVIIGFSLYSLNIYLYKLMEGYYILRHFPALRRYQQRKAFKTYFQIKLLEKLGERVAARDPIQYEKLRQQLYQISARYQLAYPTALELIMPTRFGNALRAMESYPRERYRMDAVLLWPRLIWVIPPEYHNMIDQSNNSMAFLVNCSFLSLGLAFASGLAVVYQRFLLHLAQDGRTEWLYFVTIDISQDGMDKYQQNCYLYLVGILVMMVLFVLFYRAAIPIATQYGNLVRSAFDLFRWKLVKDMHLGRPALYDDELRLWDNLSFFIGHGFLNEYRIPFDYTDQNEATEASLPRTGGSAESER